MLSTKWRRFASDGLEQTINLSKGWQRWAYILFILYVSANISQLMLICKTSNENIQEPKSRPKPRPRFHQSKPVIEEVVTSQELPADTTSSSQPTEAHPTPAAIRRSTFLQSHVIKRPEEKEALGRALRARCLELEAQVQEISAELKMLEEQEQLITGGRWSPSDFV